MHDWHDEPPAGGRGRGGVRVCVVYGSLQNLFFTELLDALVAALRERGVETERAVDAFPPLADDLVYVYVPHEYGAVTLPGSQPTAAQLRRTVVVSTEQPGIHWFDLTLEAARSAAAVVDINRLGVRELGRHGIRARLMQLGYAPAWDHWRGRPLERPIDVTFMGGYTHRRVLALARLGSLLSEHRASIHLFDPIAPVTESVGAFLAGDAKWDHLAQTRMLLNVHRGGTPYFEWQRMVGAMANGCVVVTEHSRGYEPLVPGEHFVSVSEDGLGAALAGLLDDDLRVQEIRTAAYGLLVHELPLTRTIEPLLEAVEEARRGPVVPGSARTVGTPGPRLPTPRPTAFESAFQEQGEQLALRGALRHLLDASRSINRRLQLLELDGEPEPVRVDCRTRERPRVSVLVSVYQYARYVGEAIESVALQDLEDVEVVAIDDASTDGSFEAVLAALDRVPWLSALAIRRSVNRGLPAARNLAVSEARGDLLFVLDADNAVYPHSLRVLANALDTDSSASFAYGILERFGVDGPAGLLSCFGWERERFRYGNYIDAMALIRRRALEAAGGYTEDPRVYGWEDFALWCAMADRGEHGVFVPEIVGRYRISPISMISTTNIDTRNAWAALLERYPFLQREPALPA